MSKIRVRFAPSPTGFVHLGSLQKFVQNFLFAKKYDGDYILRIEDTDQVRFVPNATEILLDIMKKFDMLPNEGVSLDENGKMIQIGKFAPYIQSERANLGIYKKYAEELVEKGHAYKCFCSVERLNKMREEQQKKGEITKYDGLCRNLTVEEVEQKIKNGEKYVIRIKLPKDEFITFEEGIRGKISVSTNSLDDYVLLKSDGLLGTYHLASTVDDHIMEISHVFRGEEWLPTAPIHFKLYEMFGWTPPKIFHMPNILGKDHKKLSKRQGDVFIHQYLEKGYLPEALLNYIILIGWNPGGEREIFSREELIKLFDIDKLQKVGGIFDIDKLNWMNGVYIRNLSIDEFVSRSKHFLINAKILKENDFENSEKLEYIKKVLGLVQERTKILSEVAESVDCFFAENIEVDEKLLAIKAKEKTKEILQNVFENLSNLEVWNHDELSKNLEGVAEIFGRSQVFFTTRVAITGKQFSPGVFESLEVLGKEKSLERISNLLQ
ncbi:MAG: glutamate--tRNA ligase [Patescibacteria group bacterium]